MQWHEYKMYNLIVLIGFDVNKVLVLEGEHSKLYDRLKKPIVSGVLSDSDWYALNVCYRPIGVFVIYLFIAIILIEVV